MRAPSCSTSHAIHRLLLEAEPDVVRQGVDARTRPRLGVLVALPEQLGAETDEEAAQIEVAQERGYYVGVMQIPALVAMVPDRGHHAEAAVGALRRLARPAPHREVHVLGVVHGCVATLTALATPVSNSLRRPRASTRA